MTELLLNDVQRHTFVGKLKRMAVPQAVRVDSFGDTGLLGQSWQERPDVGLLKRLAGLAAVALGDCAEHGMSGRQAQRWSRVDPPAQQRARLLVEAHEARLISFAVQDAHRALLSVNVL
jgi:hypothetical protein